MRHINSEWRTAALSQELSQPFAWTFWRYEWQVVKPDEYQILAKATDSLGREQPYEAEWNRKGYGYNAISRISVKVE